MLKLKHIFGIGNERRNCGCQVIFSQWTVRKTTNIYRMLLFNLKKKKEEEKYLVSIEFSFQGFCTLWLIIIPCQLDFTVLECSSMEVYTIKISWSLRTKGTWEKS